MTSTEVLLVVTNLPDRAQAEILARMLVEARVAACVNILADYLSVYRWEGKVETASETPMLIKTTRACYGQLEQVIREFHPYAVPEIIALPISAGLPEYLQWVIAETRK